MRSLAFSLRKESHRIKLRTYRTSTILLSPEVPIVNAVIPVGERILVDPATYQSYADFHSYQTLTNVPELGILEKLNFSFQFMWESVHFYTGLPWWATLLLVPFVTRTIFFPLQVSVSRTQDKIQEMRPDIQVSSDGTRSSRQIAAYVEHSTKIMQSASTGEEAPSQHEYRDKIRAIQNKHDVRFGAFYRKLLLLPIVQAGSFFSFLSITQSPIHEIEMSTGGMYTFTNLALHDPVYLLPALCGLSFFAMLRSALYVTKNEIMERFVPFMAGFVTLIAMNFPNGIAIFWIGCYLSTLVQQLILNAPPVRRHFGLAERKPHVPEEKVDLSKHMPSFTFGQQQGQPQNFSAFANGIASQPNLEEEKTEIREIPFEKNAMNGENDNDSGFTIRFGSNATPTNSSTEASETMNSSKDSTDSSNDANNVKRE